MSSQWKALVAIGSAAVEAIMGFYSPVGSLVGACCTLSILDLILGISAARKRGDKISSRRFFDKFKQLCCFMGLVTAMLIAAPAFEAMGFAATLGASYLGSIYVFYELLSLVEKADTLGFILAPKIMDWLNRRTPI